MGEQIAGREEERETRSRGRARGRNRIVKEDRARGDHCVLGEMRICRWGKKR